MGPSPGREAGHGRRVTARMTRPVVIYDGACGLCQGGIHWISRRAVRGALEFLPCQSVERRVRFPALEEARCMEAIHLVLPDGRVLAGHAAIPEILRHLNGWRRLAALFRLPGMRWLAPAVYAWIARHRYQISCLLGRAHG